MPSFVTEHNYRDVFTSLRPICVALSQKTLTSPNASADLLKSLLHILTSVPPEHVSQGVANYVFFPLKPLLNVSKPINEDVIVDTFQIIGYLIRTDWFVEKGGMSQQLVILLTSRLARAKSEELKLAMANTLRVLIDRLGKHVGGQEMLPTWAHTITLLLENTQNLELHVASLETLISLFNNLEGDTAASYLPGTVSSLAKTVSRSNQKSKVVIASFSLLSAIVTRSLSQKEGLKIDELGAFRTEKWLKASESQLVMALTPVLALFTSTSNDRIVKACSGFCLDILKETTLSPTIFVEYLLQTYPEKIPSNLDFEVETILSTYLDACERILVGADEERKTKLLRTISKGFVKLDISSRKIFAESIVSSFCGFISFTKTAHVMATIASDEKLPEPSINFLSTESQNELKALLTTIGGYTSDDIQFDFDTPEKLWLAQQLGKNTYEVALLYLTGGPATSSSSSETSLSKDFTLNIAQQAVLHEAKALGRNFRPRLQKVLYLLLTVPQPSLYVLSSISSMCEYSDVQEMIVENADYIVNALSLSLVTLNFTPRTPRILALIVDLAPSMVSLIGDVIDSYFEILDNFHGYNNLVDGILQGLGGVVSAVAKQNTTSFENVYADIEYERTRQESRAEQNDEQDIEEQKITKSYLAVQQIVEKAQIFLSHADVNIKQSILGLLLTAIPILSSNERRFLPLIHLCWPQLVRRLDDQNPYIVAQTMNVMSKLIQFGRDFMRGRIQEDILPFIQEVIEPLPRKSSGILVPRTTPRAWEGAGRRYIASAIEILLQSCIEDGGLVGPARQHLLAICEKLSSRSAVLEAALRNMLAVKSFSEHHSTFETEKMEEECQARKAQQHREELEKRKAEIQLQASTALNF